MAAGACDRCGCALHECECAARQTTHSKGNEEVPLAGCIEILLDWANLEYYYQNMADPPPSK